jgi:Spy/CpxP family protein refolding chaperone
VNSWKVILATVVIFGAGVVTGGLLVNYVAHPKIHPPFANAGEHGQFGGHEQSRPRSPESLSKQFLQQLDDALQLTPQQHDKIAKIIAEGQEQMKQVMQDNRQQIREQLTPDQRKKFEELLKQFRQQHRPPPTNAPPMIPPTNAPPGV